MTFVLHRTINWKKFTQQRTATTRNLIYIYNLNVYFTLQRSQRQFSFMENTRKQITICKKKCSLLELFSNHEAHGVNRNHWYDQTDSLNHSLPSYSTIYYHLQKKKNRFINEKYSNFKSHSHSVNVANA